VEGWRCGSSLEFKLSAAKANKQKDKPMRKSQWKVMGDKPGKRRDDWDDWGSRALFAMMRELSREGNDFAVCQHWILFMLFLFLWCWVFNPGLHACYIKVLSTELYPNPHF
jgi:hypothetical protein